MIVISLILLFRIGLKIGGLNVISLNFPFWKILQTYKKAGIANLIEKEQSTGGIKTTTRIDIKHISILFSPSRLDIKLNWYIYWYILILRLNIKSESICYIVSSELLLLLRLGQLLSEAHCLRTFHMFSKYVKFFKKWFRPGSNWGRSAC